MARTRGQRAGLARPAVLAAARALLAEQGLDGLSMRALAGRLGVRPNAIYSHVAGKTELIDALLDETLAAVEAPDPGETDPVTGLRALMTSTYGVLLRHPDLVPLYLGRQGARGEHARRLGEVMLALLADAGVTGERALEARRVLIVYTIGFAAINPREGAVVPPAEIAANFASGLDWLLSGIRADTRSR